MLIVLIKIEAKVNKINGIKNASLNFSTTVLTVEINKEEKKNNKMKLNNS